MSDEPMEIPEASSPTPSDLDQTPETEGEELAQKPTLRDDLFTWLQALVFALLCLVLVFTFLGRVIGVDGDSMYPTLHNGDMLLLQCVGYTPKPNDIVVLNKPFADITTPIVKRIIAVGGQTVSIDYAKGEVSVDGVVLDEPYLHEEMLPPDGIYETISSVVVPEGSVFVMGDNRNHSSDSRDNRLGLVDERYILGRAVFTIFPFQNAGFLA